MNPVRKHQKLAAFYFLLQSILGFAWWCGLFASEGFRSLFVPNAYPDSVLLSLVGADGILFVIGSLAAAFVIWKSNSNSATRFIPWVVLGATGYATLNVLGLVRCDWAGVARRGLYDFGFHRYFLGELEPTLKAFRPAKPASFAWNYTKTLLQTACFWFVFLYLLPSVCLTIESALSLPTFQPLKVAAVTLFLFGSSMGLSAGFIMTKDGAGTPLPPDCPNHLVVRGPYSFVRNPMALGGICQGVAVGLWLGSGLVILYAAPSPREFG